MKIKNKSVILVSSSILLITLLSACNRGNPFVETPIIGQTVIDTYEQEFVFEKPFKPNKQVNKICFAHSDNLTVDSISEPPKFSDETPLKLTAFIVDQNGRKYELNDIENSVENYLCIVPSEYGEWLDISKTKIVFIKLVVSSNRKVNMSKIQWVGYNVWDI